MAVQQSCGTSAEPSKSSLDMDFIDRSMTFTSSERCTISCGTVCVDPVAAKVLVIFNKRLGIWQLPKGRKNIGEDLQHAALRETYEETGVHASLLPLMVSTRSTKPADMDRPSPPMATAAAGANGTCQALHARPPSAAVSLGPAEAVPDPKLTNELFNTELVGITQYTDVQAATPGTRKTVFFYAARADSAAPMGPGAQEDHEDLFACWFSFDDASASLRFKAEREALWKVAGDLQRSGVVNFAG